MPYARTEDVACTTAEQGIKNDLVFSHVLLVEYAFSLLHSTVGVNSGVVLIIVGELAVFPHHSRPLQPNLKGWRA